MSNFALGTQDVALLRKQSKNVHLREQVASEYAPAVPRVSLAEATADVSADAQGSFDLLMGLPGGLTTSGSLRDAWNICGHDIAGGDRVFLQWFIQEGSGGFWGAVPCVAGDGNGGTPGNSCTCELIDLLEGKDHLQDITDQEWSDLKASCECYPPGADCLHCTAGTTQSVYRVSFAGNPIVVPANPAGTWTDASWQAAADWLLANTFDLAQETVPLVPCHFIYSIPLIPGTVNSGGLYDGFGLEASMELTINNVTSWQVRVVIREEFALNSGNDIRTDYEWIMEQAPSGAATDCSTPTNNWTSQGLIGANTPYGYLNLSGTSASLS